MLSASTNQYFAAIDEYVLNTFSKGLFKTQSKMQLFVKIVNGLHTLAVL